jgi:excisionase family DNA binding protein
MMTIATNISIPDQERASAAKAAELIREAAGDDGGLFIQKRTGEQVTVELPAAVLAAIGMVLARVVESDDVMLVNKEAELTPEQAARILGISRPLVYHRMDSGRLPYREVGTHRRVLVRDVLALKQFEENRRRASRELAEDTDDLETNYGS